MASLKEPSVEAVARGSRLCKLREHLKDAWEQENPGRSSKENPWKQDTLAETAEKLGKSVQQSSVSRWEKGRGMSKPVDSTVEVLCALYGLSRADLFAYLDDHISLNAVLARRRNATESVDTDELPPDTNRYPSRWDVLTLPARLVFPKDVVKYVASERRRDDRDPGWEYWVSRLLQVAQDWQRHEGEFREETALGLAAQADAYDDRLEKAKRR